MNHRARSLLAVTGWLAAAAAATTVGVIAIDAAGTGLAGTATAPMTQGQVTRALAGATQPPPSPAASAPGGPGVTRALTTAGGSIIARCTSGQATLISWSPAQGYQAEDIGRGPAPTATLKFEAGSTDIRVSISCPGGIPAIHTTTHADTDHD
jgi:hypothetical protein